MSRPVHAPEENFSLTRHITFTGSRIGAVSTHGNHTITFSRKPRTCNALTFLNILFW